MLPRRLRLSRVAMTDTKVSRRITSAHFSVSVREHGPGCAVVVSKKTVRTAVGRHTIKRQILSLLSPYCTKGYSFVVYTRAGVATLSKRALREELAGLLLQLPALPSVR